MGNKILKPFPPIPHGYVEIVDENQMRSAKAEELKAVSDYVEASAQSTGVNFFEVMT